MKKYEKEVIQAALDAEKTTIKSLKSIYGQALAEVEEKIRILSTRDEIQSVIYQKQYQQELKKQLETILEKLSKNQYKTVQEYLNDCYYDGYLGTMYAIRQQGIPMVFPIAQEQVAQAVILDSKISGTLYSKLVADVAVFKDTITSEISRGIAASMSFGEMSRNLKNASGIPINNAIRIVRTEGHRIQQKANMDCQYRAKDAGADVVKQWDSTLDGKTRDHHRELDGQVREINEKYEVAGKKADAPGYFGDPAEDCNCRCMSLTIARWELKGGMSKLDNFSKQLKSFDSPESYTEFKKTYWSKENIKYMNYVDKMQDQYGTKNFEKVLGSMTDREYNHYKKLLDGNPMFRVQSVQNK